VLRKKGKEPEGRVGWGLTAFVGVFYTGEEIAGGFAGCLTGFDGGGALASGHDYVIGERAGADSVSVAA
jgi:hypothetical protein